MQFKDFQKQYITAYAKKEPIAVPDKLWDDEQKVYDTFLAQTEYAMTELNTNPKLTFKERIDAVALVDFCTIRCVNIISTFKEQVKAVIDYNEYVKNKNIQNKA